MKNIEKQDVGIGKRIKEVRIKTNLSGIKLSKKIGLQIITGKACYNSVRNDDIIT